MFASCAKQMYDSRMHAVCVRSAVRFFFLSIYLHVFQIIQLILPLTKFFFQCQARLWEAQLQCVCFFSSQRSTTIARLLEVLPQQHWLLRPMFHWA
jgi:hypothetical protein